jgi:hypothetical protein
MPTVAQTPAGTRAVAPGAPANVIPFRKATLRKKSKLSSYAVTSGLGGTNNWQIDAKGYAARARLLWSGTATTATGDPVASPDFPWSLAQQLNLRDSSGGMVQNFAGAGVYGGYSAMLANRYFYPNLGRDLASAGDNRIYRANIQIVQANNINFSSTLNIEAGTKDNLGLVPNQNASFVYTLQLTVNTLANIVTTTGNWSSSALTVLPEYTYYTVPAPQRADGAAQASVPPFAGVVRQVFDETRTFTSTAETRFNLTPGKVIRGVILVDRSSTSPFARQGTISNVKFFYGDDTLLFDANEQEIITTHYELYGETPPTGVYPIPFIADNDGFVGGDFRRDILDTRRLSQIYMAITFATNTGQLDIIHDELIVPANLSL